MFTDINFFFVDWYFNLTFKIEYNHALIVENYELCFSGFKFESLKILILSRYLLLSVSKEWRGLYKNVSKHESYSALT